MKLYAYFYRRRGGGWELIIKDTYLRGLPSVPGLPDGYSETIQVAGKREARKIAAERGAICWNF